jgi:predicted RNA-binding Zn-ribbon protein involved in translation (DUF1610 family)
VNKRRKRRLRREKIRAALKGEEPRRDGPAKNEILGISPYKKGEMLFSCATCGNQVSAKSELGEIENVKVVQFYCPYCKKYKVATIL